MPASFQQIVPVFTNVVNDTSQVHACTVFSDMYEWLELVLIFSGHIRRLYLSSGPIRMRNARTGKHSRQPVSDWVAGAGRSIRKCDVCPLGRTPEFLRIDPQIEICNGV